MITAELRRQENPAINPRPRKIARTCEEQPPPRSFWPRTLLALLGACVLLWAAYHAASGTHYTPRSTVGFSLGVIGSLMMLALLAYPLRKHVPWMQRWGALKHWFRVHMILGLVGPTLVLFHSTFHIRSTNAAVALFSMLGVVISGVIGRFVYTKIHYGLYGSRATLDKIQAELTAHSETTTSLLQFAPGVEQRLRSFERHSTRGDLSVAAQALNFVTLGIRRALVEWRCARELRGRLKRERHPEFRGGEPEAIRFVSQYLKDIQRVAQFSLYERLFSLWHILHIPLIYILAASTIFHIIAAYMY